MAVYRESPKCPDCGEDIKPIYNDMGDNFVGDTFAGWDWSGHKCITFKSRGKYVSRSTYQKLAEQNKKLINDIRILTQEGFPSANKILTIKKWRETFEKENELYNLLKTFLKEKK